METSRKIEILKEGEKEMIYKVYTVDFRYRFGCDTQTHKTGIAIGNNKKVATEYFIKKNWGQKPIKLTVKRKITETEYKFLITL